MGGAGCACQNASSEAGWPVSSEPPAGSDSMPWSSQCVWDSMSFPQGVVQVSVPVEIQNPNNAVIFFITIISQSSGSPQLSIQFTGTNDLGGNWTVLGGPTNITTVGGQFLGAVTGVTFRFIRAEMTSTSGTATGGNGCFSVAER
jgi:hypothetical protein